MWVLWVLCMWLRFRELSLSCWCFRNNMYIGLPWSETMAPLHMKPWLHSILTVQRELQLHIWPWQGSRSSCYGYHAMLTVSSHGLQKSDCISFPTPLVCSYLYGHTSIYHIFSLISSYLEGVHPYITYSILFRGCTPIYYLFRGCTPIYYLYHPI